MFKIYIFLFVIIKFTFAHEGQYSIELSDETFAGEILEHNYFIMFYAPWCGFCQEFSPTWDKLAKTLNSYQSNVKIARVDCSKYDDLCTNAAQIKGLPTLKFYKRGGEQVEKFQLKRNYENLIEFVNQQLDEGIAPESTEGVYKLTDKNFDKKVSSGKHFIKFYAPWCGSCQHLEPIWKEVAESLESNSAVQIAELDCTTYKPLCTQFEVKSYPTLLWFENGKQVGQFQGRRTKFTLQTYIKKMLDGTIEEGEKFGYVPLLNLENFNESIDDVLFSFVKFYAPWCEHCKLLTPVWYDLGDKLYNNKDVNIFKVDCTKEEKLCEEQQISSFPTLLLYKNGKKLIKYSGNRTLEDLYEFINNNLNEDHDEF